MKTVFGGNCTWVSCASIEDLPASSYIGLAIESLMGGSSLGWGIRCLQYPNMEHIVFSDPFPNADRNNAMAHLLYCRNKAKREGVSP